MCGFMRETRKTILTNIKRTNTATVNQLAANLGLSPVTVRHHLYSLMADDLIERTIQRGGVGRPQHEYTLTNEGRRRFPSRYHVLTANVFSVLKNVKSEEDVRHLMEAIVKQTLDMPADMDVLPLEARLQELETHFAAHDIPISFQINEQDGEVHLRISCPYYYVSQHHPELCSVDKQIIEDALQLPLIQKECLLDGDRSCTFSIKINEDSPVYQPEI